MQVQVLSNCMKNVNFITTVITFRTRTGTQVCGSDTGSGGRESGPTVSGSLICPSGAPPGPGQGRVRVE